MSGGFFIVGGIIFSFYVYFLIWNINTSAKKNKKENYPDFRRVDVVDMDGHGNYGRFPKTTTTNKRVKRKKKQYV